MSESPMKIRRAIVKAISVMPWIPRRSFAVQSSLGGPFPFDISHLNSRVDAEIVIPEHRVYSFYINAYYEEKNDFRKILDLTGNGSRYPDGRYGKPGVIVPIHLEIKGQNGSVILDKSSDVQGYDVHGFGKEAGSGYLSRLITSVELKPGAYKVSAYTTRDTPEFSGISCALAVSWQPNTTPLSN